MKFKGALKNILYESFRPRTEEDYREILSRGAEDKKPSLLNSPSAGFEGQESEQFLAGATLNREGGGCPWLYIRVWLFCLGAFALIVLGFSLSGLDGATIIALGATFGNLGFLVLLYELYPKRDISLPYIVCAAFFGGVLSSFISQILYSFMLVETPYIHQLWVAAVEEISKGATVIILIIVSGRRDPFFCFLMGAAVGTGFSAFEDMNYIYVGAAALQFRLHMAVVQGFVRSFGAPFSHAAWAAAFGWTLSSDKPYKKLRTYAVFLFCYVMHFLVNFPLMENFNNVGGYAISAATGVLSLALEIYILIKMRSQCGNAIHPKNSTYIDISEENSGAMKVGWEGGAAVFKRENGQKSRSAFAANIVAFSAILLSSVMILGASYVYRKDVLVYDDIPFDDWASCKVFMQDGLDLNPDLDREMEQWESVEKLIKDSYSVTFENGRPDSVVQEDSAGGYTYLYRYDHMIMTAEEWEKFHGFGLSNSGANQADDTAQDNTQVGDTAQENGDEPQSGVVESWALMDVFLEYQSKIYPFMTFDEDGALYGYFAVADGYIAAYYDERDGKFYAASNPHYETKGEIAAYTMASVALFAAVAGAGAYIILRRKSRRSEDD